MLHQQTLLVAHAKYRLGQFYKCKLHVTNMVEIKDIIKKEMSLKPVINKRNGQMNFSLRKGSLPKDLISKLPHLKSIKLEKDNFIFE